MMRFMRQNAVFVLVVIVLIVGSFIGTIFLVWGRGSLDSSGGGERSVVAWIGDREVPYSEYVRAHDTRMEFYRRFYPDLTQGEIERRFKIRKGALDAVVGRRLLFDEAQRLGLTVSGEEINRKVRETAAFLDNGVFSAQRYREVLASSGVSPATFEEETRGEILVEKVRAIAQEPARVSEVEAFAEFRADKEKIRLSLLMLAAPPAGSGDAVTEAEARAAYESDPGKYTRPERIRLAWFSIAPAASQPEAPAPTEEELRAWYDSHESDYATGPAVRARHILFKLAKDAPAEEESKIRDRAALVLEKARGDADFAALAREFSQDASGPGGGELGWFERGRMVPEFEAAAFALGAGEVSDLVRTDFGYHIIKVEEVREGGLEPFEQVRGEVAAAVTAERARERVVDLADRINDDLYSGEFEDVAAQHGLEVRETGLLDRDGALPGAGARSDVAEALFALGAGDVSELIREGEEYQVFKVLEKQPAATPTFEEAREEVERDVAGRKRRDRALAAARVALEALRAGEKPGAVAARSGGEVRETASFGRREFVSEAGARGETFREAFDGTAEGWLGPVALPDGRAALHRVSSRTPASREAFEEEREGITERLLEEKRDLLFEAWLEDLRRARGVKLNEALVGAF